jgi:plasmid stabilization system protein ParE
MRVRFTRTAQRDLAEIHAYISHDSPTIASRVVARLVERSRELADHPFEGRETDEPEVRVIVAPVCVTLSSTRSLPTKFVSLTSVIRHAVDRAVGADDYHPAPISGIASSRSNR